MHICILKVQNKIASHKYTIGSFYIAELLVLFVKEIK